MRRQQGFTLLELMVAMAIFAMLAVAGWQVFDSVNRARERAQLHADNLAILQYAYLQLQQDMGQIIAYPAPNLQASMQVDKAAASTNASNNNNNNNNSNDQSNKPDLTPEPFMSLNGEKISFVRFADPDPRYQTSPSIQRIDYIFAEQRLLRRQYHHIQDSPSNVSLDSVLLDGVTAGRWQAYLPELSAKFPNPDSLNNKIDVATNNADNQPKVVLLPEGIGISFTYQDMPITWQFALTPEAKLVSSNSNANAGDNTSNNSASLPNAQ